MDAAFWHQRWQQNMIGFHLDEVNPHLQEYWPAMGVKAPGRVFMPLCGKSLDMLWLAGEGYDVVGVEISPLAIEAFFTENGLAPEKEQRGELEIWHADAFTLICGDFFNLAPADLGEITAVYDRASFIALPVDMRRDYARQLDNLCPTQPRMLITLDYDQAIMQGPPFAVDEPEVGEIYNDGFEIVKVFSRDMIENEDRFRDKGLKSLIESVFILTQKA